MTLQPSLNSRFKMGKVGKKCAYSMAQPVEAGTKIVDVTKKTWIVGSVIGQGGFGCIYLAKIEGDKDFRYVVKIEPQENGPLFTEMHFYLRVCKDDSINEWKKRHGLKYLGIPRYVSRGVFKTVKNSDCRFLIMDRFTGDLENSLKVGKISGKEILKIAHNVLFALEYIHSKDYAHADIKASNLLYYSSIEEVYLVDFGLVHLFRVNGQHRPEKSDPKYRHNGTLEFCSVDSHNGLPPSCRGDMEILAFNIIHWLARSHPNTIQLPTTGLPWGHLISDPKVRQNVPERIILQVSSLKQEALNNPSKFVLQAGFGPNIALQSFIQTIAQMSYVDTPPYEKLRDLLIKAQTSLGQTINVNNESSSEQKSTRKHKAKVTQKQTIDSSSVIPNQVVSSIVTTPTDSPSLSSKRPRGRPPQKFQPVPDNLSTSTDKIIVENKKSNNSRRRLKSIEKSPQSNKNILSSPTLSSSSFSTTSPTTRIRSAKNFQSTYRPLHIEQKDTKLNTNEYPQTGYGDIRTESSKLDSDRLTDLFLTSNSEEEIYDDHKEKKKDFVTNTRSTTKLNDVQMIILSKNKNKYNSPNRLKTKSLKSKISSTSPSSSLSPGRSIKMIKKSPELAGTFSRITRSPRSGLSSKTPSSPLSSPKLMKPILTENNSNRRRSGWCQTSPELLLVAKAEALRRRALENSHNFKL